MMDGSPMSSAILPRMSVCLKGTQSLLGENFDVEDDTPEPPFKTVIDNNGDNTNPGNHRRSLLSKSSVLLTGTSSSILASASPSLDIKQSAEKVRSQCEGVRFSETVIIRNHIHVTEITPEEKSVAWFRRPEYHAIFKNNTKIIGTVGKREKEDKRMIAKKKREERKKKKKKRNSMNYSEDSSDGSVTTFNTDDVRDEDVQLEHILGIHRDDEQGFSIRGLENETAKRRRLRDQICMKAKFAVLSIQEDVDEHMFTIQEEYEDKLTKITNGTKGSKKKSRRLSNFLSTVQEEEEEDDVGDNKHEKIEALRLEFSQYASEQYHCMISKIAQDYGEICQQNAKHAFERGLQDERAVRAINWIESEAFDNYAASIHSSGKGLSEASPESQEKRRPSNASTAATVESAASLALKENRNIRFSRMKRAKMFLWNKIAL